VTAKLHLYLAYGLSILAAGLCVVIGMTAIFGRDIAYNNDFSEHRSQYSEGDSRKTGQYRSRSAAKTNRQGDNDYGHVEWRRRVCRICIKALLPPQQLMVHILAASDRVDAELPPPPGDCKTDE